MESEIVIRKGQLTDIPELIDLLKDLFSIEEDFQFDRRKQEKGLRMILESDPDENVLLVAECESKVIGMCSAQTLISTAEGARSAMIEDMIVKDSFRGKGVGTMIMDGVVSWAKESNITRLQLLVDKNNSNGISFYKKNHWKDTQLFCLRRKKI